MTKPVPPYIVYWHQGVDYGMNYTIVPNDMANVPADVIATQRYCGYTHIPTPEQIALVERCGGTVTIKVK